LALPHISDVDISFAMSSFNYTDIVKLLPRQFLPLKSLKLNLGNVKMGSKGNEYILSLIPNGVEEL
jgi:hypothetical protein